MRATVLDFIEQLARQGTQIVMATHDPENIVPVVQHVLRIEWQRHKESLVIA